MDKIFAYKISWGVSEEHLSSCRRYLFITDDQKKVVDYIKADIESCIEEDKHLDDNGNLVNHWWKCHKVEELPIEDDVFNVVVLK